MGGIKVVRGDELGTGEQAGGITRRVDRVDDGLSLARATIRPSVVSGWHHHGDHTSYVHVLKGRLHIDWGPGGRESVDLVAGDFYVVPPNSIHREGNGGSEELQLAVFYLGTGPLVVSLEGAEPPVSAIRTTA